MTSAARALSGARAVLRDAGIDAQVGVAGHQAEILVVRARPALAPGIAALAGTLKGFGFRYITIDLGTAVDA